MVTVPNTVLTTKAKPVLTFDKKLDVLISDMKTTLKETVNPKGVGLAAPQIGVSLQVFITRPTEKSEIRVFINPEIQKKSETITDGVPERDNKLEGCLSIPKIWGRVKRATALTLQYQDEKGETHVEDFNGFLATIIQHETDHLNGTLFTHRVLEQKGKFYEATVDENGKEVLDEVELP